MTTHTPTSNTTLSELATSRAGASRVFHRHQLDFCCGGKRTLAEACQAAKLDAQAILEEVEVEMHDAGDDRLDLLQEAPLDKVVEHVLRRFHEPHRAELPRLIEMAEKVERVHAEKPGCPRGLVHHLRAMQEELELHMQKEEQILFPMIRNGHGRLASMPIHVMEREHDDHARNLATLRLLTNSYEAPEEACGTWKALYLSLAELQLQLMLHMHLENNLLFPRALNA